jgi:predicted Fe-S protein YdhL (DUF1289 family)
MGVSRLEISFRRVRVRLVAGALTSGVRMTSRRSRARRRKVLLNEATRTPGSCQVRSKTQSPCLHQAVVEIRGIPFCEACAREQEAYFAIGELTQEEKAQGFGSKPLAEALERMRRERAVSRKGIAAKMHHGHSGADESEPLALMKS